MHVKKGMTVKIISGNHKGMEGKVLHVFPEKDRVIIEGINFMKKATRPTQENPSGGLVEKEASIHISNVMVVQGGQATRIGYKKLEDGSKVRVSIKTNEEIEI
ncbi:MAG: 50S ribosomal protein L24 [Candidatus Neomarinimicrobiota bacterium]|nr:50S ribosomal protein L24 [Candidatus Neomarinimicrobiota bacterium]